MGPLNTLKPEGIKVTMLMKPLEVLIRPLKCFTPKYLIIHQRVISVYICGIFQVLEFTLYHFIGWVAENEGKHV